MQLANLHQSRHNTTLLGVVRGAADYYGLEVSTPLLFGLTGHAFLIHIHEALCPSGPYCFPRERFYALLRHVGLAVTGLGFFGAQSSAGERAEVEAQLRAGLDAGRPGFLCNMEYQLITGYDETGLLTAQPWGPEHAYPQAHLTFGTWEEFGDGIHVDFHLLDAVPPLDRREAVLASLAYAQDVWANPTAHARGAYGIGPDAYRNWLQAIADGHGPSHGNWWNAVVWAECRSHAAQYVSEVGQLFPAAAVVAEPLSSRYARVADLLDRASGNELPDADRVAAVTEAAALDSEANAGLAELAAAVAG